MRGRGAFPGPATNFQVESREEMKYSVLMKSAEEIAGFEFDWLACDRDGHVALFSTAGGGYAPKEFRSDTDAHDAAIAAILAGPERCVSMLAPALAPGFVNTWRSVAERGLYAFDSDPNGGPYRLVASPEVPILVRDLLPKIASAVRSVELVSVCFSSTLSIPNEMLKERDS